MSRSFENPEAALLKMIWVLALAAFAPGCRSSSSVSMVSGPPLMAAPSPAQTSQAPQALPARSPTARTSQECQACQGIWAKHGLSETTTCNCRTRDAGKRCRDGLECEGQCVLGDIPERIAADAAVHGSYVGRCSELVTVFGCARFLPKGAAAAAAADPAARGELPPVICVD